MGESSKGPFLFGVCVEDRWDKALFFLLFGFWGALLSRGGTLELPVCIVGNWHLEMMMLYWIGLRQ